jgi:ABC-type glycerol-3-phosphate transport system substrate-binding protein
MTRFHVRIAALLSLLTFAACSAAPTPQERTETTEQSVLASLKTKYPNVVTAFNISGNRLDISIDANGYNQTDDDGLDQLKSDAAATWKASWEKAHPNQHAVLTVRMLDFMNRVWFKKAVKA